MLCMLSCSPSRIVLMSWWYEKGVVGCCIEPSGGKCYPLHAVSYMQNISTRPVELSDVGAF